MDAIAFRDRATQYKVPNMRRELIKAYTCFRIPAGVTDEKSGIATGNWGCGAFNGNKQLKGKSNKTFFWFLSMYVFKSYYSIDCFFTSGSSTRLFDISWSRTSDIILQSVRTFTKRKSDSERSLYLPSIIFNFTQKDHLIRVYSSNNGFISLLTSIVFERALYVLISMDLFYWKEDLCKLSCVSQYFLFFFTDTRTNNKNVYWCGMLNRN